jgi:hypothetical protein
LGYSVRHMLTRTRQSQMDKAKETLREVVSYADQIVRDERLRADILAAVGHGAETGERVRADIDAAGIKARLTGDKKLRGKLRATLDDLENAGRRLRPERRHRIRNLALVAVAAGSAAAIAPSVRRWFAHRRAELPKSGSMGVEVPV